jgi:hypothetical protein
MLQNINNKKHAPKLISFDDEKKRKDSDDFGHRKLTLKVRNQHFSIAEFRTYKVLFTTQLNYQLMWKLLKILK